jgi:hypothetical protein
MQSAYFAYLKVQPKVPQEINFSKSGVVLVRQFDLQINFFRRLVYRDKKKVEIKQTSRSLEKQTLGDIH